MIFGKKFCDALKQESIFIGFGGVGAINKFVDVPRPLHIIQRINQYGFVPWGVVGVFQKLFDQNFLGNDSLKFFSI